jgi:hypothetical protein
MRKFKKFAKSRWHSIPLGAMAIALVAALLVTGTVFAAMSLISNTWVSPTATITDRLKLVIDSDLTDADFNKEVGVVIPFTVTINNPSAKDYTGIHTTIQITDKSDWNIVPSDVKLQHQYLGVWSDLPLAQGANAWTLELVWHTADILAGGTDTTPLEVTFNTVGTYQATVYSEN